MKLHRKILKILVFTVAASILLLFIAIDIIKFAITERVPEGTQYTDIVDERIDGSLRLYYDYRYAKYWLYYIKENKTKLILYTGDMQAYVYVKPAGQNKIEVYYDYSDDLPWEDESFILDLSKNDYHNISYIRRLVQIF
ncbi:MAG: hypothetical protein GXZ01_01495 [Clostridiaceae bacterium]|jgi:hypothetical protein|nr:hypothetical protein [Clostridiaceae bacterium]